MRKLAAHLNDNSFSRTESNKVKEMTLNKDTTSGGKTGFLLIPGAAKPLEVNTSYGVALRSLFHQHLQFEITRTHGSKCVKDSWR